MHERHSSPLPSQMTQYSLITVAMSTVLVQSPPKPLNLSQTPYIQLVCDPKPAFLDKTHRFCPIFGLVFCTLLSSLTPIAMGRKLILGDLEFHSRLCRIQLEYLSLNLFLIFPDFFSYFFIISFFVANLNFFFISLLL